jgi:hypothetical protein
MCGLGGLISLDYFVGGASLVAGRLVLGPVIPLAGLYHVSEEKYV